MDVSAHMGGTPAVVNWEGLFSAMVAQLSDIYKGDKTVFLVSRGDAELFLREASAAA